jgi:predicted glycosyltransferase
MERLLIYSQDGMGLGHLRRTRNIAREVLAWKPGCSILILADSPVVPFFSPLGGVDYLKLPTIVKTGDVTWQSSMLPLNIAKTVNLRAKVIRQVFREFRPDAVLVDHMPVGALGELKLLLESSVQRKRHAKFFLGLRDVLDAPEVIRRVWSGSGAYEYLQLYDAVLIYGSRQIYAAESVYDLTSYARQVIYCNYVVPRMHTEVPSYRPDEPFILVMGGGGKDSFPVARTFLRAFPLLLPEMPLRAVVLTGPHMDPAERTDLRAQAAAYPVEVLSSVEDATLLLRQATAVVTMAGYNSLCEVLAWRKKALVVPRAGPSAEQRIRSQVFSQRHLVRMLDPDSLTPERLAQELMQLLTDDNIPDPDNIPPLDGAQQAALALLGKGEGGTMNHRPGHAGANHAAMKK